jgi:hypothetical protein
MARLAWTWSEEPAMTAVSAAARNLFIFMTVCFLMFMLQRYDFYSEFRN